MPGTRPINLLRLKLMGGEGSTRVRNSGADVPQLFDYDTGR